MTVDNHFLNVYHLSYMPEVLELLTPREMDVAKGVAQGMGNKQIGARLGLAENTVKKYLATTFEKLGIDNRLQLALMVIAEEKQQK